MEEKVGEKAVQCTAQSSKTLRSKHLPTRAKNWMFRLVLKIECGELADIALIRTPFLLHIKINFVMAIISRSDADGLRSNYKNATFTNQKNIEAALFSIEEVRLLIDNLPQTATHLKVFLVLNNGFIDMCMTGSRVGTAPTDQMHNGKPEIDANLAGGEAPELLLSVLPCPPHCGQGNNGTSVNGLDSKYVTG